MLLLRCILGLLYFLHLPIGQSLFAETVSGKALPHIKKKLVEQAIKIDIPEFPNAHNPSLLNFEDGFLLIFRYRPNNKTEPWVSYIGAMRLDESFERVSPPQLLTTRAPGNLIPEQAEDARVFLCNGKMYILYNDNQEQICKSIQTSRRDMYVAELLYDGIEFQLQKPIKLIHKDKYSVQTCQKNWVPFEWNNQILLGYTIKPHEILIPDLTTGVCTTFQTSESDVKWKWGELRGGTPAIFMDNEYISFFHSGKHGRSHSTHHSKKRHYYMGIYTFSADPPFKITKTTPFPIADSAFYTVSDYHMRVVFPGGIVMKGDNIYIAYGKDDREVWIAKFDKTSVKAMLKPVK